MVNRKFNEPIKLNCDVATPFWLKEVGTSWYCRGCHRNIDAGKISFELTVQKRTSVDVDWTRQAHQQIVTKYIPVKVYFCSTCAKELLNKAIEAIELYDAVGKDGFRVVKEL